MPTPSNPNQSSVTRRERLAGLIEYVAPHFDRLVNALTVLAEVGNTAPPPVQPPSDVQLEFCEALYAWQRSNLAWKGYPIEEFDESSITGRVFLFQGRVGAAGDNGELYVYAGLDNRSKFLVAFHEYAHQLLHVEQPMPPGDYLRLMTEHECQAESVSYVTAGYFGVDSVESASYLSACAGGVDAARSMLLDQRELVEETAAAIIRGLNAG